MGNLSTCCYNPETENKELSYIDAQELSQHKTKSQEKATPNYQSIVDHAALQFLSSKPRYRSETSSGNSESVESLRGKFEQSAVDPEFASSPKLLLLGRNPKANDSIIIELSRPSVGSKSSADASLKIAELVSILQIPADCYPIDTFNPVNPINR